ADPTLAQSRTPEGATPVLWAVYTRHAELAPLLLAGRPADFFEACALGDAVRASELAAGNPAIVNQHSGDGFTGLGYACFFGHAGLAKLLLDSGADVNLAARNGLAVAPLHSAVATDDAALVEMLLARGADANAQEGGGMTPLHTAAGHGNRDVIAMLRAAGAKAIAAKDGRTPADIARAYGHAEVAREVEA
ncbi:MAG: ankyrin, partial [Candidatus Solibacter sp.]|nr:ankyrin [Candidatus Solibacter sp.]